MTYFDYLINIGAVLLAFVSIGGSILSLAVAVTAFLAAFGKDPMPHWPIVVLISLAAFVVLFPLFLWGTLSDGFDLLWRS